jgi:serine/threonine protein kinase
MKELVGQTLNRYKITQILGEGGMGAVFKAEDVTLQRNVAVKVMHPHFARQPDFRERFLQEARTAARMDHPGIVQVYDFGQHQEVLYIIMEFIPGENLQSMLNALKAQQQWIKLDEAVALLRQIALALHYAHQQQVLHRDIKPANIMLKPGTDEDLPYRPVITDLGLARLLDGARITQEGISMGTPVYMSPEQASGASTDARSDVYSLGILLFELVVGHPPFPIKNLSDALRYHLTEPPPPPRSLRPDLPEDLEQAILYALRKKPEERLPDAGKLADALQKIAPQLNRLHASTPTQIESVSIQSAVSLSTRLGQAAGDDGDPRGSSILAEFARPQELSGDSLQIMGQDRTTTTVAFRGTQMTIGRSEDADITLPTNSISRMHARFTYDGKDYSITDLNSTNGTYLDNTRLLPGVPARWQPDQAVRMGDYWLRLVRASAARPSEAATSLQPPIPAAASPSEGRIRLVVDTPNLNIEPGQAAIFTLSLSNLGRLPDTLQLRLDGIPASWLTLPPPIQIIPGGQKQISVRIAPPRTPESKAGQYNVVARAVSAANPGEGGQAAVSLNVEPYFRLAAQLEPQRVRAGQGTQVTIFNQGNSAEAFRVTPRDEKNSLVFAPSSAQVQVAPGGQGTARFTPKLRRRRLVGGSKSHPFVVEISSPRVRSHSVSGEAASKPLLPAWTIPLLLTLCMLLAAAGYAWSQYGAQPSAAEFAAVQATQTEVARLVEQANADSVAATEAGETPAPSAPTLTPAAPPTGTPPPSGTPAPTATIPPDGVSLNCDGTFQRLTVQDSGISGKTVTVDNLVGGVWQPAWAIHSGDPNSQQFEDTLGFYAFGGCQQLLVVPVRYSGSGADLNVVVYEWDGATMVEALNRGGTHGNWQVEGNTMQVTRSVYLYGEPNCCPCNTEYAWFRWLDGAFQEDGTFLEPTYDVNNPPAECQGTPAAPPTWLPPPIIFVTPAAFSP